MDGMFGRKVEKNGTLNGCRTNGPQDPSFLLTWGNCHKDVLDTEYQASLHFHSEGLGKQEPERWTHDPVSHQALRGKH